jgi:O-antigen ligase/polysaccharide polymerase Wzy-like membrane protein
MKSLGYAVLWIFVLALPWENLIVIPGLGTVSRLTGMIAFALALLAGVVSGRFRRWHAFHIAALFFVISSGTVLFVVTTAGRLPFKFQTYVQLVVVLWVIWELARTRRQVLGLLLAYVLGAYFVAITTLMIFRTHAGVLPRFAAKEFDANEVANICALALPMAWYLGMTYRKPLLRWVCRGYLLIGLIGLGLTGSRGGLLAGIVALLIVPLTMTKLSPGKLATGIILLGISGALAFSYVPERTMQRLASTTTEVETGNLGGRLRIWKAGAQAFIEQPILGHGVGTFPLVVRPIVGYEVASHNSFLTVLVEQGIVGFLLYAAMFGAVFLAVLNLPSLERRLALVLLATLVIAMLPLPWEDSKSVWFVLAALLGLAQSRAADGPVRAVHQPDSRRPSSVVTTRTAGRLRPPFTAPVRRADGDARA